MWLMLSHVSAELFPAWRHLVRAVMGLEACMCGLVPFALWDIATLVLIVVAGVCLVWRLLRKQPLLSLLSWVLLVLSITAFLFVGWACNHYAPPLAEELGLEVQEYSVDELADATGYYLREAAQRAADVPRDDDGTLQRQDFFELAELAGASYVGLAEEHDIFRGSAAPVKALLVWGVPLLYSGHTGMFWAPTGEAGVPLDVAIADTPFIMCHEAAHRLAIASEQEANFAAFLACASSDDVRFAYAGYLSACSYCLNALAGVDQDRALQVLQGVADEGLYDEVLLVLADRDAAREHYASYEGTFEKVGTAVNDTYLKSFGEASGVRSYGLVVDYLIAWQHAKRMAG